MQSHSQQGGKVHLGPGIKVITVLQGSDKLQKKKRETDRNRQMLSWINHDKIHASTQKQIQHNVPLNYQMTNATENYNYQGNFGSAL